MIPSFFMRDWRVVRFIPNRVAAPLGPLIVQPVVLRASRMCSRSASSNVVGRSSLDPLTGAGVSVTSYQTGAVRFVPFVRITARSTKFSSSRILPGQ